MPDDAKQPRPQDGESPAQPPVKPPEPPGPDETPVHEVTPEQGYGGVSWEEIRKGLPPRPRRGPDDALLDERFTSEREEFDLVNPTWRPAGTGPLPIEPGTEPALETGKPER